MLQIFSLVENEKWCIHQEEAIYQMSERHYLNYLMEFVYQTDYVTYEACYQANEQKALPNSEMQSNMSQLLNDLAEEGDKN